MSGGPSLGERLVARRDELLAIAVAAGRPPPGAEMLDAIVSHLAGRAGVSEDVDAALREALALRLAWGDDERTVLADAAAVSARILALVPALARDPRDELALANAIAEAGGAVARSLLRAIVARAAGDRAAGVREERARRRLEEALERQGAERARLEAALAALD